VKDRRTPYVAFSLLLCTAAVVALLLLYDSSAADEITIGPFLAVAKTATPDPVRAGAQLTYTLYVTNTGTVSLTTTITDILPAHVTPAGTVTWQPPRLLPTQVWSKTLLVTVEVGYLGPLTNILQVTTEEGATGAYTHTVLSMKGIYLPLILRNGQICARAGEEISPDEFLRGIRCCSGLSLMPPGRLVHPCDTPGVGICDLDGCTITPPCFCFQCSPCGNGICEPQYGENRCNCRADCEQ
jgi:uncharacterized repeat protein (TIGR01451 family)